MNRRKFSEIERLNFDILAVSQALEAREKLTGEAQTTAEKIRQKYEGIV